MASRASLARRRLAQAGMDARQGSRLAHRRARRPEAPPDRNRCSRIRTRTRRSPSRFLKDREFAMGAGAAKATQPWTQKTAPSVGWSGSFPRKSSVGNLALRRFGRSGWRRVVRRRLLVLRLRGLRRGISVGGGGSAGRGSGRSRVSLSDRGERREYDRSADPDGGPCLQPPTFSVLFASWPWAATACTP